MRGISYILSFSLICLLFACNNPAIEEKQEAKRIFPEFHYAIDTIVKTSKGIIAGVELGESRGAVMQEQVKNAVDQDKEGLVYEQKIDSATKYSITYTFENDSISEIEVLVNCDNRDEGDAILADLRNYYRQKYTAPLMDKGFYVFNCFDSKKRNFKITLTDNGGTNNAVIDLLIYREK
jgi:hypothetical protein